MNTTTDRLEVRIKAFKIKDNNIAFKQIQELINQHVPEEFRDLVKLEVDSYGYITGTYTRQETDEEYELRLERAKERLKCDRRQDTRILISILNKYNLETLIPDDLRNSIIEVINNDEW
jgi:hypothetical protein